MMDANPNPPIEITPDMRGRFDTTCCLTIPGDEYCTSRVEVFYSPQWTAVYVQGRVVRRFGWDDKGYFAAQQFALDLHRIEVIQLTEPLELDPYDWLTPEERNDMDDARSDAMMAREND